MKHTYVYMHLFEVNSTLIAASTIEEAIAVWREANPGLEVKGAYICRDGDFILSKIPTEKDIKESFGE